MKNFRYLPAQFVWPTRTVENLILLDFKFDCHSMCTVMSLILVCLLDEECCIFLVPCFHLTRKAFLGWIKIRKTFHSRTGFTHLGHLELEICIKNCILHEQYYKEERRWGGSGYARARYSWCQSIFYHHCHWYGHYCMTLRRVWRIGGNF